MIRSVALIGFFMCCSMLYAVEGKPHIRRVCLNRVTGEATVLWDKPQDACGSFQNLRIYGREDQLSPFNLLATITNFNTNTFSYILPNLKDWEFFVVYNTACNGIDSISSDTVVVDIAEPVQQEIDSVSVDLTTQKSIIGWSGNPAKDTKGYFVYFITSTNQNIADTGATFYRDYKTGNPAAGAVKYSIAAYDSCGNTAPIGNAHTSIYLTANTNICNKQIDLSWTPYVGWGGVGSYDILVNKNNGGFQLYSSVPGNQGAFSYPFSNFGDNYCFFVRAHKAASSVTASSNTACQNTNAIKAPSVNYIARVTVLSKHIEVTGLFDNTSSTQNLYLERSINGGAFSVISTYTAPLPATVFYQDNDVDVQKNVYAYRMSAEGSCNLKLGTSNESNSILLRLDVSNQPNNLLNWNDYKSWLEGVGQYTLLWGDADHFGPGSTWNTVNSFNSNPGDVSDNRTLTDLQKPLCYCILAVESKTNSLNRRDSSYSNIACLNGDPIVFFPNAFQVNGFNNTFFPKGAFLDYSKSSYAIFNRWGQEVYKTNRIDVPWDGNDSKGEPCEQAVYVYTARVFGLNGRELSVSGTVTLLR